MFFASPSSSKFLKNAREAAKIMADIIAKGVNSPCNDPNNKCGKWLHDRATTQPVKVALLSLRSSNPRASHGGRNSKFACSGIIIKLWIKDPGGIREVFVDIAPSSSGSAVIPTTTIGSRQGEDKEFRSNVLTNTGILPNFSLIRVHSTPPFVMKLVNIAITRAPSCEQTGARPPIARLTATSPSGRPIWITYWAKINLTELGRWFNI